MHPVPSRCPVCQEAMSVTRLHCPNCGTGVDGRFSLGAFDRLTPEQLAFAAAFIKNEGKLNRLERELDLSYPTLRSRLTELIEAMGYEVGQDEPAAPTPAPPPEDDRRRILGELAAGRLTADDAIKALRGGAPNS